MPNETRRALDQLSGVVVSLLWRQWAALGQAAERPPRNIVDIEALLLASEWFSRDEARLTTASETWRASFGGLISTQRLRNLAARSVRHLALPTWLNAPTLVDTGEDSPPRIRGPRRSAPIEYAGRGMPTLQLRLRLLLGVGAKADCMAVLLGRSPVESLSDWSLEQETAYGTHAIRKVTRDLAWASVLESSRDGQHSVLEPLAWWSILRPDPPVRPAWQSWGVIFAWTAAARGILTLGAARDVTAYALGAQIDALTESLGEPLPWAQPLAARTRSGETGLRRCQSTCEELARLIQDDG